MTLSNVFIGKKVVQQIYMNNALIYQAKGWETLPSTVQEVWTKKYDNFNRGTCTIDLKGCIYYANGVSLSKFDSDGMLLWQKAYPEAYKVCIDSDNIPYLASKTQVPDTYRLGVKINKIDESGNSIQEAFISSNYYVDSITNFIMDNDYLYASTVYQDSGSGFYPHLFKADKNLKMIAVVDTNPANLITTNEDQYLYYSSGTQVLRIEKSSLKNGALVFNANNSINSISFDKLGNIVYSAGSDLYKYNIDSKSVTTVKGTTNSYCKQFCIDYQQNLYSINGDIRTNYKINLVKVSSDNTVIYDINIGEEVASNILSGDLLVDNNGNIYYLYINITKQLVIKKLINLVKKG